MGEGENKMKNERKGLFGFLSMEMPHTYLLIFTILPWKCRTPIC